MEFLSYMWAAFGQVAILAVLVILGYICDKTKLYGQDTSRRCNDLLFYIITPAVIINSFLNVEFNWESGLSFLSALLVFAVFHGVVALLVLPLYKKAGQDRSIFQFATLFGNVGYMGLPLAKAVAGDLGVFYASAGVAVFNIFAFTFGIRLMDQSGGKFQLKKLILNPGSIGILIGVPLFLLKVKLPALIGTPLDYVGSLNTPMAMIMFGTYLANTDLLGMFYKKENYGVAALKLLILPLAGIGILWLCGVRGTLLVTAAVLFSAPTANNTVMFSAKYGRDTGVASKVCGLTSVLSIITMPVCIALADLLG